MKKNDRGSALVLVLVSVLILSIIGLAGLTSISTELGTARNFVADKTAFYAADSGINLGLDRVRSELYPPVVQFTESDAYVELKTGALTDTAAQPVKAFTGFTLPPPRGMSVEVGSETGAAVNPWQLTVSSRVKNNLKGMSRKQLTVVFQSLSAEY
jgi:Tfp pilus assembly protein PilX